MVYQLCALSIALIAIICLLAAKIAMLRKAADEIRKQFKARLSDDTNVGIDVTTSDRKMRQLASDMDQQVKILRLERIRCAQGDRELKAAVANLSHDLRTPLTAICEYMELLEREDASEPVKRKIRIISDRVGALQSLTDELFQYSIASLSKRYDSLEPVSLNEAIEESVAQHYSILMEKGINPDISMPDSQVLRQLNKVAISRILGNALSNAAKYSDGDLSIALSEQGVISISNHARQLDDVAVGRLFERFYTVETGQSSTGLGLSIAKALVLQMGGRIDAYLEKGVFSLIIAFN
jgi:signal transduction histidine kinase